MTEDEAGTKWCPFARMKVADRFTEAGAPFCNEPQTTFNRIAVNGTTAPFVPDQGRCIASACMAWRVRHQPGVERAKLFAAAGEKINAIKALREDHGHLDLKRAKDIVEGFEPWPAPAGGFCGLAGQPQ